MAVYEYSAVDLDASAVAGTVVADTPRQARDLLRERGLTITKIQPMVESTEPTFFERYRGRRGQAEVVAFIRELATLLAAGIPLLTALQTLAEQHHRHFRAVVQHLADQIAAGGNLAEAMEKHPTYFDELCTSIVRVGENTGSLESSLGKLADFKEKAQGLRSKVVTALIYPAVVCVVGVAVSIFLMTYVVPNLLSSLTEAHKELPGVTRVVKAASDFLRGWWWTLLLGGVGLVLGVKAILRTQRGRWLADTLVLKIPVLGDLIRKENTSRMAVVMAALLRSGVQFVHAILVTRKTLKNTVFRQAMVEYESAVSAGSDVAGPLKASGVFSPMVVQMLAVGQQSGQLEDMLEQMATSYEKQVSTATQRLTSLLEPLLIVLLAILIGFIAFATILPILEASNVL